MNSSNLGLKKPCLKDKIFFEIPQMKACLLLAWNIPPSKSSIES
jgi:hypothetical protein